jgi:hypothetical protein
MAGAFDPGTSTRGKHLASRKRLKINILMLVKRLKTSGDSP